MDILVVKMLSVAKEVQKSASIVENAHRAGNTVLLNQLNLSS
jgi:hypothetical protein